MKSKQSYSLDFSHCHWGHFWTKSMSGTFYLHKTTMGICHYSLFPIISDVYSIYKPKIHNFVHSRASKPLPIYIHDGILCGVYQYGTFVTVTGSTECFFVPLFFLIKLSLIQRHHYNSVPPLYYALPWSP